LIKSYVDWNLKFKGGKMIRKLTLPLLVALGFAAVGCEDYEAPDLKNSGPTLVVKGVQPDTVITGTFTLKIKSTDDRYTNSLGIFLYNNDEGKSLEYGYGYPKARINKTVVDTTKTIDVVASRVVDGKYTLVVESIDVQGLSDKKEFPVTITAGATNVDTLTTSKVQIWSSTERNAACYFRIKEMKAYPAGTLKNPANLNEIDIVVANIGGSIQFLSQKATKSILASEGFTASDSLGNSDVEFVATGLTAVQLNAITTSTEIRKVYNDLVAAGANVKNTISIVNNGIYAAKTGKGVYALFQTRAISGKKIIIKGYFKRFYP